jgi:hypothetical protein
VKNNIVLTAALISLFLLSIVGGVNTNFLVKANFCFPPADPAITIESPTNRTYNMHTLFLNMTVYTYKTGYEGGPARNSSRLFVYSLDGEPYEPITITKAEVGRNPGNNVFFEGFAILSGLTQGFHNLTVRVVFDYYDGDPHTESNSTVFFWIDTAPNISLLMPETDTYKLNRMPLQFAIKQSVTWIGYSLDGQENVTVAGNTTLNDLPYGEHTVTVYAQDAAGNIGASEPKVFNVKSLSQEITSTSEVKLFPTELVLIVSASPLVGIAGVLLIYFKKGKQ